MQKLRTFLVAVSIGSSAAPVFAQSLVTFEEVPRHPSNFAVRVETSGPLAFSSLLCDPVCGSAGVPVLDASTLYAGIDLSASGPMAASVSDGLAVWAKDGGVFTFHSAYLGMSHPFDAPRIVANAVGRDGQTYSKVLHLDQSSREIEFGWNNLDSISFSVDIQTGHVIIDDILVSVVPEPSAALLLILGITGVAIARSRRSDA